MESPIDFVLPWVDDNDPRWQAERDKHSKSINTSSQEESFYRDWGTLRYWFRGVEAYAPWVRKIHFITCGHYPNWLNKSHPKLCLVEHKDYIPSCFLPTFNSHTIELNLHRLDDLSEQFVYFNDDTFLLRTTTPQDFFWGNIPCAMAALSVVAPLNEEIYRFQFNDVKLINQAFRKSDVLRSNWHNWFRMRYGKHLWKTILLQPWRFFTGFHDAHLPNSFLKSTYDAVWSRFPDELEQTCMGKFRSMLDVNQWLLCYWQLCSGAFYPRANSFGRYFEISRDDKSLFEAMEKRKYKAICANDNREIKDFSSAREVLLKRLDNLLPGKSTFEL